jgi:hypothetical protein
VVWGLSYSVPLGCSSSLHVRVLDSMLGIQYYQSLRYHSFWPLQN